MERQDKFIAELLGARFAKLMLCIAIVLLLIIIPYNSGAAPLPEGPNATTVRSENATPTSAQAITTAGGSVTTIVLNGTTQTPRWKAYVGNVTGTLTLRNAAGYNIFNWSVATPQGEIYATRKPTAVDWTNIQCANITHATNEQSALDFTSSMSDSIFNTFTTQAHREFYTSTTQFLQDECNYTTATFVNSTSQTTYFQEVLLYDGTTKSNGNIVYATMVEDAKAGFDYGLYDFQLIVPENASQGEQASITYYFYLELI